MTGGPWLIVEEWEQLNVAVTCRRSDQSKPELEHFGSGTVDPSKSYSLTIPYNPLTNTVLVLLHS